MLSYELPLSLCFIGFRRLQQTCDITHFSHNVLFLNLPLCCITLICFFAETNRTPFDLPEAEAELVAGYNVEYSGLPFAFFFIREYRMILLNSRLCTIFFFGTLYIFSLLRLCFLFILIRRILPRYREGRAKAGRASGDRARASWSVANPIGAGVRTSSWTAAQRASAIERIAKPRRATIAQWSVAERAGGVWQAENGPAAFGTYGLRGDPRTHEPRCIHRLGQVGNRTPYPPQGERALSDVVPQTG